MTRRSPSTFWSQSSLLIAANVLSALLAAAYTVIVARLLGPVEYGTVTTSLSLGYLLALLIGPIETGISKFAAVFHGEGDRARLATLTYGGLRRVSLALVVALAVWLPLTPLIQRSLHLDHLAPLLALTGYAVLLLLVSVPRGTLRGDHRFAAYGINQVVESAVRLAAAAGVIYLGGQAAGALSGYAVGMAAALALAFVQLRDLVREPRALIDMRRVWAFSAPLLFAYLYFTAMTNLDMLAAKRYLGDVEAGHYGAASTLARLLYLVATPIYQVVLSRLASLKAQGRATGRLALVIFVVASAGLLVSNLIPSLFGTEVLRLCFGEPYVGAVPVLRILWLSSSLLVLESVVIFVLLAGDRVRALWLFFVPSLLMPALLALYHESASRIAIDGLESIAVGGAVVGILAFLSRR